jgi:branched-chain amino acid transport system permease protein
MQALYAQLLVGLINGSFYALLSLGLAVIFGMLNIINFAHGALYMMGAFVAFFLLNGIDVLTLTSIVNVVSSAIVYLGRLLYSFVGSVDALQLSGPLPSFQTFHVDIGLSYWWALFLVPIIVGLFGMLLERTMLQWLTGLDHLYGLLLTFGIALIIQGVFQNYFGSSGLPYSIPDQLKGGMNLGFMFLPIYRGWVVVFSLVVCLGTWYLIERTRLGANLRAATENPTLVRAFGINVPRMITLTYGLGVGLAALAGVLSAPINQVRPLMGSDLIIVVFAVVVIGGMGSIMGSIITGFALGVIEGLTKYFYPEASNTVVFVLMVLVLLVKPSGLTGRAA